jgi:ABC-type uncharacterized transport system auxiliary subunit
LFWQRADIDVSVDTPRIARFCGGEVDFCADAAWIDWPAAMIQAFIIRSFSSAEVIPVVIDRRADLRTDIILLMHINGFHALPRRWVVGTTLIASTVAAAAGHRRGAR